MKRIIKLTSLAIAMAFTTQFQAQELGLLGRKNNAAEAELKGQTLPKMIAVEGGSFMMGNTFGANQGNGYDDALPIHQVKVSTFKISETPITWAQYADFCKETGYPMPIFPTYIKGTRQLTRELERGNGFKYPVFANYYQAEAYCKWLSEKTGKNYRLPTEAEWEFAARGGNKSTNSLYSNQTFVSGWQWKWSAISLDMTVHKDPNILGICNMTGGVWEWCSDWYSKTYYAQSPLENPTGPDDRSSDTNRDSNHVIRGGSIAESKDKCTVFYRGEKQPGAVGEQIELTGFRIVLDENPAKPISHKNTEANNPTSLTEKLKELKTLYEQELITKEEYDNARKALLEK